MTELANCNSCGNVFARGIRDICPACYKEEEMAYQKVYKYLSNKRKREATIDEIARDTEVDKELIMKFLKQNRLRNSNFPKLSYPCEMCGIAIVEGKLCVTCSVSLHKQLHQHEEEEKKRTERIVQEEKEKQQVYYTINKDEKR